jgi:hypothetical protein
LVDEPSADDRRREVDRITVPGEEVLQTVVHVADFIGNAAVAGLIGNRVDVMVRRLFQSVRDRWRERPDDDALTREEAVDAATAAAMAVGYPAGELRPVTAERRGDGSWVVVLHADGDVLRATVPPGDPSNARILIV